MDRETSTTEGERAPVTAPPATFRLGHRPGLDGLRGLAIAMVVVSHLDPTQFTVGVAGVVLFFVLSGFLITSLLLEEWARRGSVSLRRFYGRRATRLFPALVAVVAISIPLSLVFRPTDPTADNALSTVLYVANWRHAIVGSEMGAFGAMWSLAIEEQFYLVWPPVLIGLLALGVSKRIVTGSLLAVVLAIVVVRGVLASDSNWLPLFFGTPSRIDAVLLGSAVAVVVHQRGLPKVAWPWLAVAGLMAGTAILTPSFPLILAVAIPLCTVASVIALLRAVSGPRGLAWAPLRWLGLVSYGLYLWHVPIVLFLPEVPARPLVIVVLSLAAAAASRRWIEAPFLARRDRVRPSLDGPASRSAPADPAIAIPAV